MIQAFCNQSDAPRFAARLLADTDCQANGLVERGYAALAQPGGTISLTLTSLLAIAVAFFGYRMLFGRGVALRDAVTLAVKIGVVLLIATSWDSWQTLAYQGLARAPTQVAGEILTSIGAPDPIDSLQRTLEGLAQAAVGYRMRAGIASPLVGGPPAAAAVLNLSSVFLTLSIVGVLVAARIVLALLLAIAPAMAGLLLFKVTRGMVEGWLAAMAAAAIAPLFVLVMAAVEFAILNPMLGRLIAEQASGQFEDGSVMPLGLVTVVFLIATFFGLRSGAQIARGLHIPQIAGRQAIDVDASTPVTDPIVARSRTDIASNLSVARTLESLARNDSRGVEAARGPGRGYSGNRMRRSSPSGPDGGGYAIPERDFSRSSVPAWRSRSVARRSRSVRRRDG